MLDDQVVVVEDAKVIIGVNISVGTSLSMSVRMCADEVLTLDNMALKGVIQEKLKQLSRNGRQDQ